MTALCHGEGCHLVTTALLRQAIKAAIYQERYQVPMLQDFYRDEQPILRESGAPNLYALAGCIMLGGIFDLNLQHKTEVCRGIEEISSLVRLFGESDSERSKYSPTQILEKAIANMTSGILCNHLPSSWLFIHGHRDEIVPYSSSNVFFDLCEQAGILNTCLKSYEVPDHAKYLYDLFLGTDDDFYDELELYYDRINELRRYKRWLAVEQRRSHSVSTFFDFQVSGNIS